MAQTLEEVRAALRADAAELKTIEARITENARLARALGATAVEIGQDIGRTPGRVSQIAPKPKGKAAAPAMRVTPVPPKRVPLAEKELAEPFRAGASRIKVPLSDLVSDRWSRKQAERPTIFLDQVTGDWFSPDAHHGRVDWRDGSAAAMLDQLPPAVERVYLVGANRPGVTEETKREFGTEADAVRMWFLRDVAGWRPAAGGHFLADEDNPVGRWEREGQHVEVLRASGWFGEGRYGPADAARAWYVLRGVLAGAFGPDAIPMSTPATTGRDMWRRTIGRNKDGSAKTYPVLSDELRELIQSTSGQGRREILHGEPGERIPGFVQYDMRFAYAALAWGLPVGAPEFVTGKAYGALNDEDQERELKKRGRWLIRATVPKGWDHVGLLPAPTRDVGWCYPREGGQTFQTWASGGELDLAHRQGWQFEVIEGFTFREEKPLNIWREKLTKAYAAAEAGDLMGAPAGVCELVRSALRSMVLMTIGAFASRAHMVSKSAPATPEGERMLPADRPVREVGGMYLWEEPGERSEWVRRLDHPEWSAEIWARCRTRLLDAPTGVPGRKAGALYVPPNCVLGMRTDALYLAIDPEWPDDGEPGRYRLKGKTERELARPVTDAELDALKRAAAADLEASA